MDTVIKTVEYMSKNGSGQVQYILVENQCVFSGITISEQAPSTVNAGESIILAISRKEKVNPQHIDFYDLQTPRGYNHFKHGEYGYKKLQVAYSPKGPRIFNWAEWNCPPEVLELFGVSVNTDHSSDCA